MIEDAKNLNLSQIKSRILPSFLSLTARQILLRAIGFISINLILAKILPVETLGIFNIATSIITFFAFFSDLGLAASLIQKKDEISETDIKTTFTIQQTIVTFLSIIIIVAAPILGEFYQLQDDGVWLIRVLGLSFLLSSLKVVPAVLLERILKFEPLVFIEIVETIIFNVLLLSLAFWGAGLWSFSIAALFRGIIGTGLLYLIAPARIGFQLDRSVAKKLLTFGVPFQLNTFLALIKDRLIPLVVAKMVGAAGIGYITWSQSVAFLPLEIMNITNRITFPAFSRLQHDEKALAKAVEKSLFITTLLSYPILFGLIALVPSLVLYIVSTKWQPALFSFYLFSFNVFLAIISTTLTNTLNAMGHIKTTFKLMVVWTALTWVLTPILVILYNFNGVALASFFISFTSLLTVILVKRVLAIKVLESILLPTIASSVMGISIYFFAKMFVRDYLTLILSVFLGAVLYLALIFIFGREKILSDLKTLRNV